MSMFGNFGGASTNTGGNIFGGQNTNQPAASPFGATNTNTTQPQTSSIFGNTNTNTNTAAPAAGGLFGGFGATANNTATNTNQPTTGSSLFGGATNTNATNPTGGTSLFGNTATNTNTNANATPGTTGSIFGNTTGSSLFGGAASNPATTNTNTTGGTGGGLFGGNAGGGLFGSTTNTQQQQAGNTTGTGLFGTNTQQPAAATTTGTGLFGTNTQQPAANTTGTGLFGNTQTAGSGLFGAKPATGGGLFGSTTTTTPTPNTNTNTGLFGGGSIFGGQQQQQQQQQPQQQQPQQPQQQSSLFGSSLFGGNKSTLGTSALGAPAQQNTGLGSSSVAPTNIPEAQAQFAKLVQDMERIYSSWDPSSKDCRFQFNFYNLVDPKQVSLYGRPPNATNDAVWEKAVRENPDPSCLVPVVAIGFEDLRTRVDAQTAQSAFHLQKLNDLQARLKTLRTQHSISNASRLMRAASTQTQIVQRLTRFIQHLHLLLPTIRSSALRPEEEALRGKLEELEEEMRRGRVQGRLNELWALIGSVSASIERANGSGGEWAVVDEEGLAQIAQILSEQQVGLQHLTKILQKGQDNIKVIKGIFKASIAEAGAPHEDGEKLWGSTTAFRASGLR